MTYRPVRKFLFRLALALGRTVQELENTLSGRELTEWMIYDSINPIGEIRGDIRNACLMALLANINRDPKYPPFKADDFLISFEPRQTKPRQSVEEQAQIIKSLSKIFEGGK